MSNATTIRHWGVWPVTRPRYLVGLGIQVTALLLLGGVCLARPGPLPTLAPGEDRLTRWLVEDFVGHLGWFWLACTTWIVADAVVMLGLFWRKARHTA
jgi:hypothetical protein